jgi:hypothetical protein
MKECASRSLLQFRTPALYYVVEEGIPFFPPTSDTPVPMSHGKSHKGTDRQKKTVPNYYYYYYYYYYYFSNIL